MEIPCAKLPGLDLPVGSCTYQLEDLLSSAENTIICDQLLPDGQECGLPLNPGHYGGKAINDYYTFTIDNVPGAIVPFINASIDVRMTIMDDSENENLCLVASVVLV